MARGKLSRGTQRASQVRVGLVLVLGIIFLIFGTYQVGRLFDVFAPRYNLITLVESAGGIIPGAPVTLAGQRVGQVEEVRLIPVHERVSEENIVIRLGVNRAVQDQIRDDSRAMLRTQGLLGDRFIDIKPGSPTRPMLEPGDTIVVEPPLDIEVVLETAARTLDHVQVIAADLQVTTERLARGEGTLGALLTDDRLYQRMMVASAELATLLNSINHADGTLSRLIHDPTMYERMDVALARLDSLAAMVMGGQGTMGRLLHDDGLYEGILRIVDRADTTLAGVEGLVLDLTEADGTVRRLMEDPELYDQLLRAIVDVQNLIQAIRDDPREFRPEVRVRVF